MSWLGIDPGLDGGIALLTPNTVEVFAMPTIGTGKRVLDLRAITGLLGSFAREPLSHCVLEQQGVRPGQGAVSGFKLGEGYGALKGVLAALAVPYEVVRPAAWKKALGLPARKDTKARKAAAIELARSLFPDVELRKSHRCRVAHDGIAEALLLAEHARRRWTGGVA